MKTAVTGASGRIGLPLVEALLAAGHEVRVLSHRKTTVFEHLPVEMIQGSVLERADMDRLVQDCEVVFHLAAVVSIRSGKNEFMRRVNIEGTHNVLDAAHRHDVRRVVYFSTIHAFSETGPDDPFDETRPLALDCRMAYSRSKAEALQQAFQFAAAKSLEIIALCPTSVIGPFDHEPSLSGRMFIDFDRGKIPLLAPGGFDWVDVRDVINAAVAAMHRGKSGQAYLLSGSYATLPMIARMACVHTGKPVPQRVAPYRLLRTIAPLAEIFARITGADPLFTRDAIVTLRNGSKYVSSEKARRELGYQSRPLEETIADAYRWFEQNNYL